MKFAATLALAGSAAVASASILSETEILERDVSEDCTYGTTALQAQQAFVYPLFEACKDRLIGSTNLWGNPVCVAAAVVGSPGLIRDALSCTTSDISTLSTLDNLDYGVYAEIVGSCAYASSACSITQQNLIDFVYREIGSETDATWPTSSEVLVSAYIAPLMEWTATGESIPYTNFNDWLHYAPDDTVEDC